MMRILRIPLLLLFLGQTVPVAAQETMDIYEAIEAVIARRDALRDRIEQYDLWERPGTSFNSAGVPQHWCSILGRLLGMTDLIEHLEREYTRAEDITNPNLSDLERQDLSIDLLELDNWVSVAYQIGEMSHDRRVEYWNLECAGQLNIPISAYIESGNTEEFHDIFVDHNGNEVFLRVLGDVVDGYSDRLESALDAHPDVEAVLLGSEGGNVREAILAGLLIRSRGLNTLAWANCYSACPLVLLGGVNRDMWRPYSEVGFHRVSVSDGSTLPNTARVYEIIADYARTMGADPNRVLAFMFSATPDEIAVPDFHDLCSTRVLTWIQGICSSQ